MSYILLHYYTRRALFAALTFDVFKNDLSIDFEEKEETVCSLVILNTEVENLAKRNSNKVNRSTNSTSTDVISISSRRQNYGFITFYTIGFIYCKIGFLNTLIHFSQSCGEQS